MQGAFMVTVWPALNMYAFFNRRHHVKSMLILVTRFCSIFVFIFHSRPGLEGNDTPRCRLFCTQIQLKAFFIQKRKTEFCEVNL